MQGCSRAQQRLASRAFSFLVTEWGTKMAYPERLLARILKVRLEKLQPVLQKLNTARVLRDDHRPEGTWYELYHDVFAEIIETWNRNFQTARRRLRRIVVCLCLLGLLILPGHLCLTSSTKSPEDWGR